MAIKREKVVKQAQKLIAKGKIEAAIKEYRKVLAENPNDANILNQVGDLYARIERFDEAVKLFSQIADQYSRDGFFVKAIAIYKKIIKLAPTSLQVYERLADLYFKQGLTNEARTQYKVLADHYEKRGNAASAITIYQRMSEIDPENPAYHLKLAQFFQAQRLTEKALGAYRQLADLLVVAGSVDEAVQVYAKAIEAYPEELDFVREVGGSLHREGHGEAAEKVLARARELNPQAETIARELFGGPEAEEPEVPRRGEMGGIPEIAPAPAEEDLPFEVPSVPVDQEPVSAAAPLVHTLPPAADDAAPETDSFFTLDLDLDGSDTPDTQVRPPDDMLAESVPAEPAGDELEIDMEDDGPSAFASTAAAAEEAAQAFAEPDRVDEDDWSPEQFEDEIPIEIEEDEFEIDLEASGGFEIESPEVPEKEESFVRPPPGQSLVGPPPGEPEASEAPPRHEDDLLAEAKVFVKYGLREKAEDRLHELLKNRPEHLGGLCLMAKVDLDSGRHQEAIERANEAARVAATSGDLEPWQGLREEFGKAGFELEDGQVTREPEVKPADGERFAQLLEELDETGDYVPEVLQEPVQAEPAEPLPSGPTAEVVPAAELELPPFEEPEPPAAEKPGAQTKPFARPVLPPNAGDETVAVGMTDLEEPIFGDEETIFGEEEEEAIFGEEEEEEAIFEEEPVEAAPLAAEPPPAAPVPKARPKVTPPGQSLSEIEALMERARQASGFEEFVPEETPLADLEPGGGEVPESAAPGDESGLVSLTDELGLGDLAGDPAGDLAPVPAVVDGESDDDETGMSWLDDPEAPAAEAEAKGESIFDEEDDFFDLAAELEAEMDDPAESLGGEIPLESQEQSLQEIIDGFKKGVAENLSTEDYDTHFNLGIAYREMGLLDEAIGEFQLASKDPRFIVDASSMLGVCFLEKGLPELAVKWYRKGLESPVVEEEQALGLLYDMASCYLHLADYDAAYRTYVEIYGMNSTYRDVAERIQEMNQNQQQPTTPSS